MHKVSQVLFRTPCLYFHFFSVHMNRIMMNTHRCSSDMPKLLSSLTSSSFFPSDHLVSELDLVISCVIILLLCFRLFPQRALLLFQAIHIVLMLFFYSSPLNIHFHPVSHFCVCTQSSVCLCVLFVVRVKLYELMFICFQLKVKFWHSTDYLDTAACSYTLQSKEQNLPGSQFCKSIKDFYIYTYTHTLHYIIHYFFPEVCFILASNPPKHTII